MAWLMRCVHACSSYGQGSVQAMSLAGYVAWWQAVKAAGQPATLYLKDWHFVAEHPEHQVWPHCCRRCPHCIAGEGGSFDELDQGSVDWRVAERGRLQAYSTPVYAQEDWLNEFFDAKCAASGGAAGALACLHADSCCPLAGPV